MSGRERQNETGREPFQCSECRLWAWVELDREDPRLVPQKPPRGRAKAGCWKECPSNGPRQAIFAEPNDPTTARSRYSFETGRKLVRVCTPYVRKPTKELQRLRFGPLLEPLQIFREWHIKHRLATEGPSEKIDLHRMCPLPTFSLGRAGDWFYLPHRYTTEDDEWMFKARQIYYDSGGETPHPDDLLQAMRPDRPDENEPAHQLLVAIDLRAPIGPQLKMAGSTLVAIQEHTHRLCEEPLPRPARTQESAGQHVYIYLLATAAKWRPKQIAALLFPEKIPILAEQEVRDVCTKIRKVLRRLPDPSS